MPDAYTRIAKPTGTPYIKVNANGFETYDDVNVFYDDAMVAFDGGDGEDYVRISKPIT